MVAKTRNAPPRASAMMESLRGLGYSTSAALADIIDNSISAGANEVRVKFHWADDRAYVYVLDNGTGMDDPGLELAMTLGDKNPLDARESTDLGRFGIGLKTASLSQCRRLTVASRKNGIVSCLRWDLDEIAKCEQDDWLIFEGAAPGSELILEALNLFKSGTLVLWEVLDKILANGYTLQHFLDLIDSVESSLAMTFHRMIQGPNPIFKLYVNDIEVKAWDPFMIGHPSKPWESPVAVRQTDVGLVEVQCHVLPHKDKLTEEEFLREAGPEGWTSQQGFYIYRNKRLLHAGGWLSLGQGRAWPREEAHRLARIRLDIPNTADSEWKIDVKKSTARPPVSVRPWLTRLAEDTRGRARQVFAFRGAPQTIAGERVEHTWKTEQLRNGGVRYRIDQNHPAISSVLEATGMHRQLVLAMLRVIEETVPVQKIWLDTTENKDTPRVGFELEPDESVLLVIKTLYEDMVNRQGMSSQLAKQRLLTTEPFQKYPSLVEKLG